MTRLARYTSFASIDFDGNMDAVLRHLRRYIDDPATTNAFWERFKQRLAQARAGGAPADALLLMHSHVYYMVELFEEHEDEEALAALRKLEEECF
ncbi:N(2)-fixation sustaining protein CowN [Azospirillum halopraeferens]|uniref:N(2)-fixation sustaining protein CowN n=1 Tax=Azospirillum halopraeferens TaxID=34010 RepID=UPI001FE1C039|nr:N(2)-fixation sustaining protein CowN [Azospirillum halopraeferens]